MTRAQRETIRVALRKAGFTRPTHGVFPERPDFYDRGDGVYTEIWTHEFDRTNIELRWDIKTLELTDKLSKP